MTVEERTLSLRKDPDQPVVTLTRGTASGRVGRWLLESQRRRQRNSHMLCVRLTHPDGRVLDLVFDSNTGATNARGAVATKLSNAVGGAFRGHRSAAGEAETIAALARVFAAGWGLAGLGHRGELALEQMQATAHGISPAEVGRWRMALVDLTGNVSLGGSWVPVSAVAVMHGSGLTPEQVIAWFDEADIRWISAATARAAVTFQRAGWHKAHVLRLAREIALAGGEVDIERHRPTLGEVAAGWARLSPTQAMLAARAGLDASEARRLVREGRFDEATLRTLATLRGTPGSDLLGLATV